MWPVMISRGVMEGADLSADLALRVQGRQVAEPRRDVQEDAGRVDIGVRETHVQPIGAVQYYRPEDAAGQPGLLGRQANISGHPLTVQSDRTAVIPPKDHPS